MKDILTTKQARTAKLIRKKAKASGMGVPTKDIITEAHAEVYDISAPTPQKARHIAATIAGQNLKRPEFKAALGFDDKEIQGFIGQELLRNLRGQNPLFGKDRDVYRDSLKIAARLCWPESTRTIIESGNEYSNRSLEELQYFVDHGKWPEKPEKRDGRDDDKKPN